MGVFVGLLKTSLVVDFYIKECFNLNQANLNIL